MGPLLAPVDDVFRDDTPMPSGLTWTEYYREATIPWQFLSRECQEFLERLPLLNRLVRQYGAPMHVIVATDPRGMVGSPTEIRWPGWTDVRLRRIMAEDDGAGDSERVAEVQLQERGRRHAPITVDLDDFVFALRLLGRPYAQR
jgi:hypothetical protein